MGKKIERNCQHERNEMHKIIQEATATFSWYKRLPVGAEAASAQQSCTPSQGQNLIPSYNKQLPDNSFNAIFCVQIPVTLHFGRCTWSHRTTSWPKDSRTIPWTAHNNSSPLCPITFVTSLHTQTMQEAGCPKGFLLITWSPGWEAHFKTRDWEETEGSAEWQRGNNRKKKRGRGDTPEAKWDKHSTKAKVHHVEVCMWQAALVPAKLTDGECVSNQCLQGMKHASPSPGSPA